MWSIEVMEVQKLDNLILNDICPYGDEILVDLCYTLVYKLTKMYMNGTWHLYAQEYLFLAY